MEKTREIDKRENLRTVTSNSFITACGLSGISLKARKLLYVAISQCRQVDGEFYEYSISAGEFAGLIGISVSHVYEEAEKIASELMKGYISVVPEGGKHFRMFSLFDKCEYTEGACLKFKLNKDMTSFLLELKGNFTKPLLQDFLHMNSPYSMAIWHLMQREMHSAKPGVTNVIEFDLTLEELRQVTGAQGKLKQIGQFKDRVLDKALREISDNCAVKITYQNIKTGRAVTGFHFTAISPFHVDESKVPQRTKDRLDLFQLKQTAKKRGLTIEEKEEYNRLCLILGE